MGPFSEEKQLERAEHLNRLIQDPSISPEARTMWEVHLRWLTWTQEDYAARARTIYAPWQLNEGPCDALKRMTTKPLLVSNTTPATSTVHPLLQSTELTKLESGDDITIPTMTTLPNLRR